jgi:hypothetical protein
MRVKAVGLRESGCVLDFTYKLLNSATQFLWSMSCTGTGYWGQVSVQAIKLELLVRCNPGARAIVRQPLTRFMTAVRWNTILMKPRENTCIREHNSVFEKTDVSLATKSRLQYVSIHETLTADIRSLRHRNFSRNVSFSECDFFLLLRYFS